MTIKLGVLVSGTGTGLQNFIDLIQAGKLDAKIEELDAVLLTHEHADHTHGIDDLRPFFVKTRKPVDIYMDEPTAGAMHARSATASGRRPAASIRRS